MESLWIVIGCLFIIGIGIRFLNKFIDLKISENITIFVMIILLIGINSSPIRIFISKLF